MEHLVENRARAGRRALRLAVVGVVAVSASVVAVAQSVPSVVSAGAFPGTNGQIIYLGDDQSIHAVDPDGSNDQVILDGAAFGGVGSFAVSADGTQLAFTTDSNSDVYKSDIDGTDVVRLTTAAGQDFLPSWSPDGNSIYFTSSRSMARFEIFRMSADGSGQVRVGAPVDRGSPSVSPDGTKILFTQRPTTGSPAPDVYVMSTTGGSVVRLSTVGGTSPSWSPDGTKILFSSWFDPDRIFVMNADGTSLRTLVDPPPPYRDQAAAWSPDGTKIAISRNDSDGLNELYVLDADGTNAVRLDGTLPFAGPGTIAWAAAPVVPPDATVRVTDPAGVPIVGAPVTRVIFPNGGGIPNIVTVGTDANGTVLLDLQPGLRNIIGQPLQLNRPDLASSADSSGPLFDAVWDGTPFELDVIIPFLDVDVDGIPDVIECVPDLVGTFCDDDGVGTSGEVVVNSTGLPVEFIDLPDPDGVRVVVGGATGNAKVHVCGYATLTIPAGGEVDVTCGSVTVGVNAGDVLIVPDAGDFSTVSIPAGVTARISDVVDDKFTVTHLSGTGVITVTVDGVPVEIAPGGESGEFVTVNPDVTPPVVTGVVTPAANDAGWNNTPVVIDWVSVDPQPSSGVSTDPPDSQVAAEGEAIEVVSQPSCDPSGNCATGSTVVNIDLTDPVVSIDGVVDGQVFDIGQAPTPSCTTVDPLAGVGQAATVSIEGGNPDGSGVYTVTCDGGTDLAGNQAPAVTATFEVHYLLAPNTFTGGSVDPAPVVNTGKAGRTYPVRWTLTDADGNRITNVAAVTSIRHRRVDCALLTGQESEALSAESSGGGLSVSGSGEFKFNWATPSTAGCRVLEIALVDGNTLLANFDLR